MASIAYWQIGSRPWNTILAIDEFGPGTLDGNPVDGGTFDACGPATIENAAAGYEARLPNYSNIGHIRADMMSNGEWTKQADGTPYPISDPRTTGCFISNVAWEIPRRGYVVAAFHDYQDNVLTEADIRTALAYRQGVCWIVTNAQALSFNEQNVHGHFVVTAAYGGDLSSGATNKQYILNSDIAGQHGTATGQWTDLATFLAAQPHGYAIIAPKPATIDIAGAIADTHAAIAASQDALVKLGA